MLEPKHAALALVAIAVCLNLGYAVFEGGFTGQLFERIGEKGPGMATALVLRPVQPREGDMGLLTRNLSLAVGSLSGDMTGLLEMSGTTRISVREGSIVRAEEGSFKVVHELNGTVDLSLTGSMVRTVTLPMSTGGTAKMASMSTSVVVRPTYGPSLSSISETTIRPSDAHATVLPWSFLISGIGDIEDGKEWTMSQEAVLEGLSLRMDLAPVSYRSLVTRTAGGGLRAVLTAECRPFAGFDILYTLEMDDRHPWPLDLDARAEGLYMSDDGPVVIDLRYRESLVSWASIGGGGRSWPGPFIDTPHPSAEVVKVGEVPSSGPGATSFAALPSQCLEHAKDGSTVLVDFLEERGPTSPARLSYYRNDSRPADRSWVWNITLASAPGTTPLTTFGFRVSCLSGDRFGRDQLELLEVSGSTAERVPPTGRGLLTLSSHETMVRSSPLSDSFFTAEGYSQSYRLDIVHRGGTGPDPMNVLLQNMLGIHRSDAADLFVSTSSDRLDPKTLCISVVDGSTGSFISTTKAGGSFTVLLGSYGFELA